MSEEIHDHLLGSFVGPAHGVITTVRQKAFKGFRATIAAAIGSSTVEQVQEVVKATAASNGPAAPAANTPQLTKSTARAAQQQQQATPAAASTPPPAPRRIPVVGRTAQLSLKKGLSVGNGP